MKHFTYIANTYSLRNSLEKAIYTFLESKSRLIIPHDQLGDFKNSIIQGIQVLNEQFPRCKPLQATWGYGTKHEDLYLWIGTGTICNFHIYSSKPDFTPEEREEESE